MVLQVLFMQQNQRVKNGWPSCFASTPSYSLICIVSPQRGQGSPSPGITMDFFRFRLPLNAPPRAISNHRQHERSQSASVRDPKNIILLEFGRHVPIRWQVAVDFETDANFNQNGCSPRHVVLPL